MTNKFAAKMEEYPGTSKNGRNFIWNTLGIAANSINSLFFLTIVTRTNGLSDAGVFSLCFANAIIFSTIALYGVRAYQVTDFKSSYSGGEYLSARLITCIAAMFAAGIFVFLNRYDAYKSGVTLLLTGAKSLEALSDVYYGILQKKNRLDIAGKANFLKSAAGFTAFLIILVDIHQLIVACLSLIVIDLGVFIFYELRWVLKTDRPHLSLSFKPVGSILSACFYVFAVSALSMYLLNAPRYAIDKQMTQASQGIYGIIVMPGTTISLLTAFLIQFFLSIFAQKIILKDKRGFCRIVFELALIIAALSLLFELFCYFWGIPLLKLLFGVNLSSYLQQLLLIVGGVSLLSISTLFCSALTSLRYTKIQLFIFAADTVFAVLISPPLVRSWGILGAASAFDLISVFQVVATGTALLIGLEKSKYFNKGSE